jgi:hypothetical protein
MAKERTIMDDMMEEDTKSLDVLEVEAMKYFLTFKLLNQPFKVSDQPMASKEFYTCQGLVLLDGTMAGLAHVYAGHNAKGYIRKMLKAFGEDASSLKAIVMDSYISQWEEHDLGKACEKFGIKVIETVKHDSIEDHDGNFKPLRRDILVVPSRKEVTIYSEKGRQVIGYGSR